MKLLQTAIALAVVATATTATVTAADAHPRYRTVRECQMMHHHRVCHVVRHAWR